MRSRPGPTKSDLILLGISAACVTVVASTSNLTVDVIAGLPLSVYIPGAAMNEMRFLWASLPCMPEYCVGKKRPAMPLASA